MKLEVVVSAVDNLSAPIRAMGKVVSEFGASVNNQMTQQLGSVGTGIDAITKGASVALPQLSNVFGAVGSGAKLAAVGFQSLANVATSTIRSVIAGLQNMVGRLWNVGRVAVLVGAGLTFEIGRRGINAAMQMEQYLAKLQVALKDTGKAAAMMDWAKSFAATTPFEVGEVVEATARLEMYGLSAKKWLPLVGNMAGAMGRNVTDAVEAVADVINGGGLERIKEFGINSQKLLQAGAPSGGQGSVSYTNPGDSEKVRAALEKLMSTQFGGGMEKMMGTAGGALSNFKDSVFAFAVSVGQTMIPAFRQALSAGQTFMKWLTESGAAGRLGQNLGLAIAQGMQWAAQAINWLVNTVLTPEGMARIGAWFAGIWTAARTFLGSAAQFVKVNAQAIGQWISYIGDYAKYLAASFWNAVPDVIDLLVKFGGAFADYGLVALATLNAVSTGFKVFGNFLAGSVLSVVELVGAQFLSLVNIINGAVQFLNKASGGKLFPNWAADAQAFRDQVEAINKTIGETKVNFFGAMIDAGREGRENQAKFQEWADLSQQKQQQAQAWAAGVRQKWSGMTAEKPTAPAMDFAPWQTVTPTGPTFTPTAWAPAPQAVPQETGTKAVAAQIAKATEKATAQATVFDASAYLKALTDDQLGALPNQLGGLTDAQMEKWEAEADRRGWKDSRDVMPSGISVGMGTALQPQSGGAFMAQSSVPTQGAAPATQGGGAQTLVHEFRFSSDGETVRILTSNPGFQDAVSRAINTANYRSGSAVPAPAWGSPA